MSGQQMHPYYMNQSPPPQPAHVIVVTNQAGPGYCSICQSSTGGIVDYEVSSVTWVWCILLFFFTGICCWIPFFCDSCKRKVVRCSSCNSSKF